MAKEKPFIERHPIMIAAVTAVIGGFFGGMFPFVSNLYQIHCSLAKEKSNLESELCQVREKVSQQNERIADLRASVGILNGKINDQNSQLAIKDLQVAFFSSRFYDQPGSIITNVPIHVASSGMTNNVPVHTQNIPEETAGVHSVAAAAGVVPVGAQSPLPQSTTGSPMLTGPVSKRLGLTDDMSLREKIEIGWGRPLYVPEFPGLYLRAPKELLTCYLGILDNLTNYPVSVSLARKAYAKVEPMLDPFVKQGAEIDVRFANAASTVYQLLAEDELNKGNYDRAAFLIGTAAGILGPKPPPHLLAMESAISMRRNPSAGFMSRHIMDAINYAKDENYTRDIFQQLANLGYLQYFLPNKDNTDVGEAIDWDKLVGAGKHIRLLPTSKKGDDVWSMRWKGLGEYETYNVSEDLRQALKPRRRVIESNPIRVEL